MVCLLSSDLHEEALYNVSEGNREVLDTQSHSSTGAVEVGSVRRRAPISIECSVMDYQSIEDSTIIGVQLTGNNPQTVVGHMLLHV